MGERMPADHAIHNATPGGGGKESVHLAYARSDNRPVFRRLLSLLRPWRGTILVCIAMLTLGGLCEIFPAFVWKYVADDVAMQRPSSPMVAWMASFGGRVSNPFALIFWAVCWLLFIYVIGEVLTTVQNNILSRIT